LIWYFFFPVTSWPVMNYESQIDWAIDIMDTDVVHVMFRQYQ